MFDLARELQAKEHEPYDGPLVAEPALKSGSHDAVALLGGTRKFRRLLEASLQDKAEPGKMARALLDTALVAILRCQGKGELGPEGMLISLEPRYEGEIRIMNRAVVSFNSKDYPEWEQSRAFADLETTGVDLSQHPEFLAFLDTVWARADEAEALLTY